MTKLTPKTARLLRIDLAGMEAEQQALEARIQGARLLLNGSPSSRKKPRKATPFKPTGLAGAVKTALAGFTRGCTSGQLAAAIEKTGFQWNSKAPLIRAVNAELYRMAKSNNIPIKKVGRGKYKLVQGETA